MRNFQKPYALFIGGLVAIIVCLACSFSLTERHFLRRLAEQSDGTLRLVAAGLQGALQRFEPLPVLLANMTDMKWLLTPHATPSQIDHVNGELKKIARDFGASDIYVMDRSGVTVSSSNFDTGVSFIGEDFSYRPYFIEAIRGKPTSFFALGTTSLKRGYYFAAPIMNEAGILGVVVVKIGVDALEENWRGPDSKIFVSDKNGIIFMASEENWHFKSLIPLTRDHLDQINLSKQYPAEKLSAFKAFFEPSGVDNLKTITIADQAAPGAYLENRQPIADTGWTLHVLMPRSIATNQAYIALSVAFLLALLGLLIVSIALQRRARLIKNIAMQKQTQEQLELRVAERTHALNTANRKLIQEVNERIQTENQLRSTQNELIQAGKLAALGQMSAALSHELNQPLAAIKSYADNARTYLERQKFDAAHANIGRISEMADRMAELSRHLRNFARKPQTKIDIVTLSAVFDSAFQIMSPRLKETGAHIDMQAFDDSLAVKGGLVRLQQVMVNLINNALDAMKGAENPVIAISLEEEDSAGKISVRDFGTGLDEKIIGAVFDPFFTTKGVNEGLGLGLSVSYNIIRDFGGSLSAENHPEGGAVFTISLERADLVRKAAE